MLLTLSLPSPAFLGGWEMWGWGDSGDGSIWLDCFLEALREVLDSNGWQLSLAYTTANGTDGQVVLVSDIFFYSTKENSSITSYWTQTSQKSLWLSAACFSKWVISDMYLLWFELAFVYQLLILSQRKRSFFLGVCFFLNDTSFHAWVAFKRYVWAGDEYLFHKRLLMDFLWSS